MSAFIQIGSYLVETIFSLYLLAVIIRFLLQQTRADFYNPISQFFVKVTDPTLRPLRRVIPGFAGIDWASIVLALLVQLVAISALLLLNGYSLINPLRMLSWGSIGLLSLVVNFYFFAVIAMIVVSWIAPHSHHPAVVLLHQLTRPVMAPFQRLIPAIGGLDLSPIFVFIAINVVKMIIGYWAVIAGVPERLVLGF